MASIIYTSVIEDMARGAVDFDTDTFFVMLTTSSYTENKDTHTKRSDITNEVSGTGYTAGGQTVVPTIAKDTATDRVTITFPTVTWTGSSITARKAVYYKSRGGAASADELICVNDEFGGTGVSADVTTSAATFTLNASSIRFQN
jgi:hypothetical protein